MGKHIILLIVAASLLWSGGQTIYTSLANDFILIDSGEKPNTVVGIVGFLVGLCFLGAVVRSIVLNKSKAGQNNLPAGNMDAELTTGSDKEPLPDDPADVFEKHFLEWLWREHRAHPVSCTGTNSFYWQLEIGSKNIQFVIIGKSGKNTATPPSVDWILRVEEAEPLQFIPIIEDQFIAEKRIKRKINDDGEKIRMQFKSTELKIDSGLMHLDAELPDQRPETETKI